jgi:hypothetical protein
MFADVTYVPALRPLSLDILVAFSSQSRPQVNAICFPYYGAAPMKPHTRQHTQSWPSPFANPAQKLILATLMLSALPYGKGKGLLALMHCSNCMCVCYVCTLVQRAWT